MRRCSISDRSSCLLQGSSPHGLSSCGYRYRYRYGRWSRRRWRRHGDEPRRVRQDRYEPGRPQGLQLPRRLGPSSTARASSSRIASQARAADGDGARRVVAGRDEGGLPARCDRARSQPQDQREDRVALVTRYSPPVCKTEVDFAAGIVAQCERRSSRTSTSRARASVAHVQRRVRRAVRDRRRGASAPASAPARATAAAAAVAMATRTSMRRPNARRPPRSRERAHRVLGAQGRGRARERDDRRRFEVQDGDGAIDAGMPAILRAGKKLELAGKALVLWVQTVRRSCARRGARRSARRQGPLRRRPARSVLAASANIQARFSVSIEVSPRSARRPAHSSDS